VTRDDLWRVAVKWLTATREQSRRTAVRLDRPGDGANIEDRVARFVVTSQERDS